MYRLCCSIEEGGETKMGPAKMTGILFPCGKGLLELMNVGIIPT